MHDHVSIYVPIHVTRLLRRITGNGEAARQLVDKATLAANGFRSTSLRYPCLVDCLISVRSDPSPVVWLHVTYRRPGMRAHTIGFFAVESNGEWCWKQHQTVTPPTIAEQHAELGLAEGGVYLRQLQDGSLERFLVHASPLAV